MRVALTVFTESDASPCSSTSGTVESGGTGVAGNPQSATIFSLPSGFAAGIAASGLICSTAFPGGEGGGESRQSLSNPLLPRISPRPKPVHAMSPVEFQKATI